MAVEILEGLPSTVHGYQHDLESLFYVLIWICTMQNGPCGELRDIGTFQYRRSVLSVWNGGLHSATIPFQMVAWAKRGVMGDPVKFKSDVLDNFASYFEPIKGCMENIPRILFPKPLADNEVLLVQGAMLREKDPAMAKFFHRLIPLTLVEPEFLFKEIRGVLNTSIRELIRDNHHIRKPRTAPAPPIDGSFFILHPVSLGVERLEMPMEPPKARSQSGLDRLLGNASGEGPSKRRSDSDLPEMGGRTHCGRY